MGKSITPTYRLEISDMNPHTHRFNNHHMAWDVKAAGKPTDANLEAYILRYAKSHELGGVNAHISTHLGYTPFPYKAQIVHQKTHEVKATWKAAMFQVW